MEMSCNSAVPDVDKQVQNHEQICNILKPVQFFKMCSCYFTLEQHTVMYDEIHIIDSICSYSVEKGWLLEDKEKCS